MDPLVSAPDHLLLTGYRARPGVYDEMVGADGDIRPHWRYLAEALGTLGLLALHDRWREARRLLRESGATYQRLWRPAGARAPVAARSDPGAGLERRVARDRVGARAACRAPEPDPARHLRAAGPDQEGLPAARARVRTRGVPSPLSSAAHPRSPHAHPVCRGRRARTRRPRAGALGPHAGAVGGRLRAPEPSRDEPRAPEPLPRLARAPALALLPEPAREPRGHLAAEARRAARRAPDA